MNTQETPDHISTPGSPDRLPFASMSKRQRLWWFLLLPGLIYLVAFVVMTLPAILKFSSHYWCGAGDGLQMVWNTWWANEAISELHQLPWYTRVLYYPEGTHLLVHTFHPLKGLMGTALLPFMSLAQTYNSLIIFSYVMTGLTMMWFAYSVCKSYWPSIVGGFVLSFCNYHFAHTQGHMQLISMEWIPLFLLLWRLWRIRPDWRLSVGSAVVLFMVLMCDHYYFLYCVMTGGMLVLWDMWVRRDALFVFKPPYGPQVVIFVVAALGLCAPLVLASMHVMRHDPPITFFEPSQFSMDFLALLIPGGHWMFNDLTEWYWSKVPGKIHGSSVHVGIAVLLMSGYAFWRCRHDRRFGIGGWSIIALFFAVMALGPRLYIAGWEAPYIGDYEGRWLKMPYEGLAAVLPPMKVGARPNRLVLVTIIAFALLVPIGLRIVRERLACWRRIWGAFLVVMFVEYLPSPLPMFSVPTPKYVEFLVSCEEEGALYDANTRDAMQMYYQTLHERPLAFGYISRTHTSLHERRVAIHELSKAGNYRALHEDYGFRFLLERADVDVRAAYPVATRVVTGTDEHLYDLSGTLVEDSR